jgi:hypothetical protein
VGERILGDSIPKNPRPENGAEKSPAAFLGKDTRDREVAFRLTFIDSRGTAASYAESVNFERWGLEH